MRAEMSFYYSPGSRTVKAFDEAVPGDLNPTIRRIPAYRNTKPSQGHLVLAAGEGKPTGEVERFAGRIGAFVVCVPEAGEWLTQHIRDRIEAGLPLVMVDAALATTKQLSGAK